MSQESKKTKEKMLTTFLKRHALKVALGDTRWGMQAHTTPLFFSLRLFILLMQFNNVSAFFLVATILECL